ncbi:MAG: tRNA pseudouridine(38-40) synthase TruA [Sedimentisphaerales bacterium]|nr:tRNA pseudouridine(38-40) synthase TruA [Sedimentisphaerales bacterium]
MSPRNIKLTISYDGTDYHGWQRQKEGLMTIQQALEEAIARALGEQVNLRGSGRTDAGVHAAGQVANFMTNTPIPTEKVYRVINKFLPADICALQSQDVPDDFDAIASAKSKLYRYAVFNHAEIPIKEIRYCCHYYHPCDEQLMRVAALDLVGEHDFASFSSMDAGNKEKNTVRTIYQCRVWRTGHYLYVDVEGNGFLYNMVRNIVGTLLEVGRGRLSPDGIPDILAAHTRRAAGHKAPANGLSLQWVKY